MGGFRRGAGRGARRKSIAKNLPKDVKKRFRDAAKQAKAGDIDAAEGTLTELADDAAGHGKHGMASLMELRMGAGFYRKGDTGRAMDHFKKGLEHAKNAKQKKRLAARYGRAIARVRRKGDEAFAGQMESAVKAAFGLEKLPKAPSARRRERRKRG